MSQLLTSLGIFISYKWLALAFVSLAIGIGMIQKYGTLEKSQTIVCLILLVGPDISEILRGLFRLGHLPPYPDWVPWRSRKGVRFLKWHLCLATQEVFP